MQLAAREREHLWLNLGKASFLCQLADFHVMSDHAHDHSHAHAHAHSHEHGHGDCCEVHDHDDEPIIEDVSDQISKQKLDNHTHSHANGSSSKPEPQQAVAALDALLSKPLPTPGRPTDPPKGQGADDRHGHGDDINGYDGVSGVLYPKFIFAK